MEIINHQWIVLLCILLRLRSVIVPLSAIIPTGLDLHTYVLKFKLFCSAIWRSHTLCCALVFFIPVFKPRCVCSPICVIMYRIALSSMYCLRISRRCDFFVPIFLFSVMFPLIVSSCIVLLKGLRLISICSFPFETFLLNLNLNFAISVLRQFPIGIHIFVWCLDVVPKFFLLLLLPLLLSFPSSCASKISVQLCWSSPTWSGIWVVL